MSKFIIPNKDQVLADGSIRLWGIDQTEPLWGVEKLTDLSDIDYSPLKEPKEGYIYVLGYKPNKEKRFSFFPIKDPSIENEEI